MIELLKGSTIIQGVATLIVIAADSYMAINGIAIPEVMVFTTGAMVGFWFGSKIPYSQAMAKKQTCDM